MKALYFLRKKMILFKKMAKADDPSVEFLPVSGTTSAGQAATVDIRIPGPFTLMLMLMLMKLHAFRDRLARSHEQLAQHHALDLYRIVAMLSRDEFELVQRLTDELQADPAVQAARGIVAEHFRGEDSPGTLRLHTYAREQFRSTVPLEMMVFLDAMRDMFCVTQQN